MTDAPLVFILDDAELLAASHLLTGADADPAALAVGRVRLQARSLLAEPPAAVVDAALARVLGACLRADVSVAMSVRQRALPASEVLLTFHRRGETLVEHAVEQAIHTFVAFTRQDTVLDHLMRVLSVPVDRVDAAPATYRLGLADLEHARAASAADDRPGVRSALQAAGADTHLAQQLTDAMLAAKTVAQLLRFVAPGPMPTASVTVIVEPRGTWSFEQPTPDATEVIVTHPSVSTLRGALAALFA